MLTQAVNPEKKKLVLAGKELPINELIHFEIDRDALLIPSTNREHVISYIKTCLGSPLPKHFKEDDLRDNIVWKWVSSEGKLPKVVRSYIHKKYDYSLLDSELAKIGDLALQGMPKTTDYYFDISTTLDWRKGDFGDHNSCFMSETGGASGSVLKMMNTEGFYALRFFKDFGEYDPETTTVSMPNIAYEDKGRFYLGISRCWLYSEDDTTVVFNGYGNDTETSAEILTRYLNTEKCWISTRSTVMMNGGGGYKIGTAERPKGDRYTNIPKDYSPNYGYDYVELNEQAEPEDDGYDHEQVQAAGEAVIDDGQPRVMF